MVTRVLPLAFANVLFQKCIMVVLHVMLQGAAAALCLGVGGVLGSGVVGTVGGCTLGVLGVLG